jgi:helix-turn-helix protein
MFGLEEQKKKKKPGEFVFDLEKDLKSSKKQRERTAHIEAQIGRLKAILRAGEEKDEFDSYGLLLHGYTSALKVLERLATSKGR